MNEYRPKSQNTVWHHATVTRARREQLNGHKSAVVWLTGFSGAGKSTLAHEVEERLLQRGCRTFVFDGDNVRQGLCGDLGYSPADRGENMRRIGEMVNLFMQAGLISITAFISPFRQDRERVRQLIGEENFIEIYCRCSLEICEHRDNKGLYRRARAGQVKDFTGISSPYEPPEHPRLILDTGIEALAVCADKVVALLHALEVLPPSSADKA